MRRNTTTLFKLAGKPTRLIQDAPRWCKQDIIRICVSEPSCASNAHLVKRAPWKSRSCSEEGRSLHRLRERWIHTWYRSAVLPKRKCGPARSTRVGWGYLVLPGSECLYRTRHLRRGSHAAFVRWRNFQECGCSAPKLPATNVTDLVTLCHRSPPPRPTATTTPRLPHSRVCATTTLSRPLPPPTLRFRCGIHLVETMLHHAAARRRAYALSCIQVTVLGLGA